MLLLVNFSLLVQGPGVSLDCLQLLANIWPRTFSLLHCRVLSWAGWRSPSFSHCSITETPWQLWRSQSGRRRMKGPSFDERNHRLRWTQASQRDLEHLKTVLQSVCCPEQRSREHWAMPAQEGRSDWKRQCWDPWDRWLKYRLHVFLWTIFYFFCIRYTNWQW